MLKLNKLKKVKELGVRRSLQKLSDKFLVFCGVKTSITNFYVFKVNDVEPIQFMNCGKVQKKELAVLKRINIYQFHNIDEIYQDPNYEIFVARDCNNLCGFCFVHFSEPHSIHGLGVWKLSDNEAWIGPAFVKKEYRGQGINGKLLALVKSYCRNLNISKIYTSINSSNISSIKSFERNGFNKIGQVIKERNNYYKQSFDIGFQGKFSSND